MQRLVGLILFWLFCTTACGPSPTNQERPPSVADMGERPTDDPPVVIIPSKPPTAAQWLANHPQVATAIKWQHAQASLNAYTPPTDSEKQNYTKWSTVQKADLETAYKTAYDWLRGGATPVGFIADGLTDRPSNNNNGDRCPNCKVAKEFEETYMWRLYVAQVGFSLALETSTTLGWSITGYNDEQLRELFDSAAIGWRLEYSPVVYTVGTSEIGTPYFTKDNRAQTPYAPPRALYNWLASQGIVGENRLSTIVNLIDWMRHMMTHYYGPSSYTNHLAVWGYAGFAPLGAIIEGTIDTNNPDAGVQHWTAGCHGSVGFMVALLKSINIPTQPIWVCEHELISFPTEGLFLDHGDNPYANSVKVSPCSSRDLLIDEAAFRAQIGDPAVNINEFTDQRDPLCRGIGRTAAEF